MKFGEGVGRALQDGPMMNFPMEFNIWNLQKTSGRKMNGFAYLKVNVASSFGRILPTSPALLAMLDVGFSCARLDVAWSVCLCVEHDHELCKTAEPIEMPF